MSRPSFAQATTIATLVGIAIAIILVSVNKHSHHDAATSVPGTASQSATSKAEVTPPLKTDSSTSSPGTQSGGKGTGGTAASASATATESSCPGPVLPNLSSDPKTRLTQQAVMFLESYYWLCWDDTHASRLKRVQAVQPDAPNYVYGQLDLSVNTTTPDNQLRVAEKENIVGVVDTQAMQVKFFTPTDAYVFAPVTVTADGHTGTVVKSGSTWLYKHGSWVINSFREGGDS